MNRTLITMWWWVGLVVLGLASCQTDQEKTVEAEKLFTLLSPTQTGIDFQNTIIETEKNNHLINDMIVAGAGVAIGDINSDGLPDIYLAGNQESDRLYLNLGGLKFEDISQKAGLKAEHVWSSGVTMADVNGDGHLDIYVCKSVQEKPQLSENLLYVNKGNWDDPDSGPYFSELGSQYGLSDRGFSVQATFFDADRDGLLDVYVVNQPPSLGKRSGVVPSTLNTRTMVYSDRMYWNRGNGKFEDVTLEAGLLNLAYGLSATAGDLNNDGWMDLYVSNDFNRPDHLYINRGDGTFENRVNQGIKHISNFSMGTDIADYDNNGLLDIMVVDMVAEDNKRIKTYMGGMVPENFWKVVNSGWHYQYMYNTLQRNNGNGTFSEVAHLAGVSSTDWSWGPLFADFDNDGYKDLFVSNGIKRNQRLGDLNKMITTRLDSLETVAMESGKRLYDIIDIMEFVEMAPSDPIINYLYQNNGDLTFSKKMKEWGLDQRTFSYGGAYADLDLDGDIDLVLNNVDDLAFVYRNNSQNSNYLRLRLVNQAGSPMFGARATVYRNGEPWQMAELSNTRGYMSKSEDVLHFGLSGLDRVELLEVIWPDGRISRLNDLDAGQVLTIDPSNAEDKEEVETTGPKMFQEVTEFIELNHKHRENDYNDYRKEVLLPHKMSNFGPGLAVGDVNRDGLEDFYVGGAAGYPGFLYLQISGNKFKPSIQSVWQQDQKYEDLGSEFFDADLDGDLDLYVVSGGNEFDPGSADLQDRLYLNDGSGNFSRSRDRLPEIRFSGSRIRVADMDGDKDLDLFVGGRVVPGAYPTPARSAILRNDGGYFVDITQEKAPELMNAGLVTDAAWLDLNGDQSLDLCVVGEWMPVTVMIQEDGGWVNRTAEYGLEQSEGWYYSIVARDMDQDGDQDLIVGNLGLNYKYKASLEEPFEVFSDDFDGNGSRDIVLSYYQEGIAFPLRGRSCSAEQIPQIGEKFPTYSAFGEATLIDVYGEESLDQALNYKAHTFASSYLQNDGGTFQVRKLPNEAQLSSINNILVEDYNNDGNLDILISGNLYPVEIETPRNDAGMGLYLKGDGTGNFEPVPLLESGFFAPHDAKDMRPIQLGRNKERLILIANNSFYIQAILHRSPKPETKGSLLSSR